jgi:UDP-2,3-diacylglucosamine pyrophosphatase LpxH
MRDDMRTLFLSDVHLGSIGCRAAMLGEFLRHTTARTIYLVGDIVDYAALARRFYWPHAHDEVLRTLVSLARRGHRIIYVPGNHDIAARAYCGMRFGRIEVRRQAVHRAADGRRLLVMHGDELDRHMNRDSLLNRVGEVVYARLLALNSHVNDWRDRAGLGYLPIASAIKHKSRKAHRYMEAFRAQAIEHARERGFDGCITGHIHRPEVHEDGSTAYYNCGDWVEHCTALGERADGRIELIEWARQPARFPAPLAPSAVGQAA